MSANEQLALVWDDRVTQIVVIMPALWKHYPGGDWFVSAWFNEDMIGRR